ncbi:MAG: efflux RND transporter periplasmic adaptor subunit [Burkholderiaceae bacterium]|nr:MAG: efflux RND transporter periplasmic adaptor subunit [Burkholderiaceae bacterium]
MNSPFFQRRSLLLAATTLLVLAGAVTLGLGRDAHSAKPPEPAAPPVNVTLARVQQQDMPIYQAGVGTVTPLASVTVKAQIDGQLERVGFTEGQDVKAGQMLAQLDPRAQQAQVQQAQAQKAKDQAQLANARLDLKRYTTLLAQDAATQQQFDTQKALVAQLDAAVKVDDAQINSAQVQLSYTKIVAPISGRVGARLVDPGNIVHASDANGLVVINQIDPIAVVFTLPGDAVQVIHRAQQANPQPLKVQVFTRDDKTLLATGQLVLVNNQIDTSSGTVQLKGRFANPTHRLWPGQYLNVHLVLGDRARALTVPAAVVQRNQEGTYAYVVSADDTVRLQPIKVALIQDGTAIIDAGLTAGERVVLDGQYKITTGTRVAAAPASAAAGAASAAGGAR